MTASRATYDRSIIRNVEKNVLAQVQRQLPTLVHKGVQDALTRGIAANHERKVQNGVLEPATVGKCREVWNALDKLHAEGKSDLEHIRRYAAANGWNTRNTVIEFYLWRRFQSGQV